MKRLPNVAKVSFGVLKRTASWDDQYATTLLTSSLSYENAAKIAARLKAEDAFSAYSVQSFAS